mgnify:CR=1 FL=1
MAAAAAASDVKTAAPAPGQDGRGLPRQKHVFVVCTGQSCVDAGSSELIRELRRECRHALSDVRVGASRCMGHCQLAPAVMENGRMMGWVSPRRLRSELRRLGVTE